MSMYMKLFRPSTGLQSEWNPNEYSDPKTQVHVLTGVLGSAQDFQQPDTPEKQLKLFVADLGRIGIEDELDRIPKIDLKGTYYRAREIKDNSMPIDFGPPPKPSPGRFNSENQMAHYLATTSEVSHKEVAQNAEETTRIWIQKFIVKESIGKMFSLPIELRQEFPLLNQLMLLAIFPNNQGSPDAYHSTRFLRDLCEERGIDAIEYPPATGLELVDKSATNIVIISETSKTRMLQCVDGEPFEVAG